MRGLAIFRLFLCFFAVNTEGTLLDGIYCGRNNCYDVLDVGREATKSEIGKNYRKLAKKYHPDLHRDPEAKLEAAEQFKIVATAYEILKDDESRADYDYMLDNPDEYYAHYYRYYRRRITPKVDVRLVIFVTITVISIIQYYSGWQRYDSAIQYFLTVPKYRNRALDIAKADGLIDEKKMKGKHKLPKDEVEQIIKKIIEHKMDIKGAYARPTLQDVLWIKILMLPYSVPKYLFWYFTWFWRHTILSQPYDDEEKLYLIRKLLKMSQHQFDNLEDEKKEEYVRRKLWVKENFEAWFEEEELNAKKSLAENARYKQYRRYIKNHGVGRMTFDDS